MNSGTNGPNMRWWERWVRLVPAFVLVIVATHQLYLSASAGLSPWSGGGFGMFSTTDAGANRHLHAFVLRPGIEREVEVPEALKDRERRALTLPSDANLRALALELAKLPAPDHGAATAVRIQVWRTRFDPNTLVPVGGIHRALKVSLEQ